MAGVVLSQGFAGQCSLPGLSLPADLHSWVGEGKTVSLIPRFPWHDMDSCDNDNEARNRKYPGKNKDPNLGVGGRTGDNWRRVPGSAFSELDTTTSAGLSVPMLP